MKKILIIILTLGTLGDAYSQANDCISDFEYLVKKIEADYPGYQDKVTEANKKQLNNLRKTLSRKIKNHPDSCFFYLKKYTDFFNDGHLRVEPIRKGKYKNREKLDKSSFGKNMNVDADSLYKATKNLKGIEGIWWFGNTQFAVVKTNNKNKYLGVALKSKNWKEYQVMYEFIPENNSDTFEVIEHTLYKDLEPRRRKASLHAEGKILEVHNKQRYVRKSDSPIYDKAIAASYIPKHPSGSNTFWLSLALSDSTFYLRIPNFYSEKSNRLIKKYWNEITSRPNLIVDIRNNDGGQSLYYQELLKLIYTHPYVNKGVEWYATEGIIKSLEEDLEEGRIKRGEEGIKWTKALLKEMRKNKGGFVVHPHMGKDTTIRRDTIYPNPKRVGIIINENNASAAESFLLEAKNSEKVTLFGSENTAGIKDYSNAVFEKFPSGKYKLKHPWTRSRRLPENPIDDTGIAPEITIPLKPKKQLYDRLDSWAYFVKRYYEFM